MVKSCKILISQAVVLIASNNIDTTMIYNEIDNDSSGISFHSIPSLDMTCSPGSRRERESHVDSKMPQGSLRVLPLKAAIS